MREKGKKFWAALLILAMVGQQVLGVYAADMGQIETGIVEVAEESAVPAVERMEEAPAAESAEAAAAPEAQAKAAPEEQAAAAPETQAAPKETEAPAASETQAAPKETEAPAAPKAPETQAAPKETEAPAAPETQAAPKETEAPAAPETQAAPKETEAPAAPETQAAPKETEASAAPEASTDAKTDEASKQTEGPAAGSTVTDEPAVEDTEASSETLPETTEASKPETAEDETTDGTAQEEPENGESETQLLSEAETQEETEGLSSESEETETETESETETETETETEIEAVLESSVKQEAFAEADGSLSVKYTIEVTNTTPDADAENIAVRAILGQQAFYYSREGQTPGAQYIDAGSQKLASLNWTELSACTPEQLQSATSALAWEDQTITADGRAEYVFFAHVGEDAECSDDVKAVFFVDGGQVPGEKIIWINGDQIKPQYAKPQTYTWADEQVTVEVTVPEGVRLPYGAALNVTPLPEGSAEYEAAVAAIESVNGDRSFAEHVLYDISFVCDGQSVEPEGGDVFVSMEFARPALQITDAPAEILEDEVVVSHILEDETVENVTQDVQTTADGAVEQAAFATGSFSIYALSRSVTYNGVFDTLGVATVLLDDGTEIKVEGFWGWFLEGSKVNITPLTMKFPYRIAHGELKNGIGYQIEITDSAGNIITPGDEKKVYSVTIRKANGLGIEALGEGVKGIRSIDSSALKVDPTATYTGTECKVNDIAPGADSRVLVGSWDYSNDTFISTGGIYSLGYILNKYNSFIRNDLTGTHIVGPVVAGGAASVSLGGSTTKVIYPHDVPDYAGTYPHSSGTVTTFSKVPVYFGKAAEGREYTLVGASGKEYDDYYFASQFVDFDTAMRSLQGEAAGFDGEEVKQSGGTVELAMGGRYAFTAAQLSGIETLDFTGTLGDGRDTFIIVKDSAGITIPKVMVNGAELQSIEAGESSGIVFLFPNTTAVSGGNVSGHIVAPLAHVDLTGGYFNGCIIADSLKTSAEGHMWNYNGSALMPCAAKLQAGKTVDGKVPDTNQDKLFTFALEEFVTDGWEEIESVKNQGGSVSFKDIYYTEAGTHWYRITETGRVEGYTVDSTQYLIKVVINVAGDQVGKEVTYYKVKPDADPIKDNAVDEAALEQLELSGSSSADVITFDNRSITPAPETVSKTVKKIWKDGNNQGNVRPQHIKVQLLADGKASGQEVELNQENGWSYTWSALPDMEDGKKIVYTVREITPPDGYQVEYSQDTFTITNTWTGKTSVSGEKTWNVPDGQDLPEKITVKLMNGDTVVETKDVTAKDEWKYSFTDLDMYDENNKPIVYTIDEEAVAGYSKEVDGYNITNTWTGKTTVSGQKTWKASAGAALPEKITVKLMNGDTVVETKDVTAKDEWKYSFTDLDMYDENNKLIVYTIDEEAVAGYSKEVDGYNITNTWTGKTTVSGQKTWKASAGAALPEKITVKLMNGDTVVETKDVTAKDEWKYSFTDLDMYDENNEPIVYTIDEETVAGYSKEVDGYNITNTWTGKTTVSGEKTWKAPAGEALPEKITVKLMNGDTVVGTKDVTAADEWKYSFTDLDMYDENNEPIVYTIDEEAVAGYNKKVNGYNITNTRTGKTSISGEKTWNVPDGEDLPESITVKLMNRSIVVDTKTVTAADKWKYSFTNLNAYDENGQTIKYTVEEEEIAGYDSEVDGYNITNTWTGKTTVSGEKTWNVPAGEALPEKITVKLMNGDTVVGTKDVTAADEWKYSFTDLDMYDENNEPIVYTIDEEAVAGYSKKVDGYNITNTRTGKTSISGQKTWNVPDGEDLPESITVKLMNGSIVVDTKTVTAADKWKYSFTNLNAYDENGQTIKYTVEEAEIAGYDSEVDGYNITNTWTGKTTVSGEKTWKAPAGEALPEKITVKLLNGNIVVDTKDVTADGDGKWKYSFTDLDMYDENNEPIVYTIDEEAVAGYNKKVDGYNITNTRTGTTSIAVSKLWKDADNQDGKRPESITIHLLANGTKVDSQKVSANESGEWSYVFENLPEYKNGEKIVYTVTEDPVEDYIAEIDGYVITNSHTPDETSRTVTKIWQDQENRSGARPAGIQVQLLADGEAYGEAVELNVENKWSYTWNKLPERKAGKTIVYTAKEISQTAGYVTSYSNDTFTITNTALHFNVNKVALGNGEELDGAKIVVIDKETGKELASWTSVKGETHDFGDVLTPGRSYILREKVAPIGYNYTTDIEFSVGEDGTVTSTVKPALDDKGNEVYLVQDGITVLSVLKVDRNGNGVYGARLVIKDAAGKIITDEKGAPKYAWISDGKPHVLEGIPAGSYILSETAAPAGYELAADVPFTVSNEKDAVNEVVMVDERSTVTGSLTVTKTLKLLGKDLAIAAPEATFYVALFADEARTQRISEVKAIEFRNQSASKAVFENLKAGTYYVGETDAAGNLIEVGFVETVGFEPVYGNGYTVKLESDTFAGQMSFDNMFYDLPHGFMYEGFLEITKKVVKDGNPYETDDVFYAGVFFDAAYTKLYEMAELSMNGNSSTTVEMKLPIDGDLGKAVTFYVTEVDENGIPLTNGTDLGFSFSVDHTEVKVSGDDPYDQVVIVNDYSEEESEFETEIETEEEKAAKKNNDTGVKTGDSTDFMTYTWLLGISAAALLLGGWKRRKNRRASE